MFARYFPLILAVFASIAWADPTERPNLTGNWKFDPSHSEIHSHVPAQLTWQIEQTGDAIHLIQHSEEGKGSEEIKCGTNGKDCKVKDEGRSVTVSFYYNGPVLVELELEGGDNVTKKRWKVSNDGSTLTVDVIHVSPTGKPPEKLVLTKQTSGTTGQ